MAKKKIVPSERELDILKVLWELGEAKVREIHEAVIVDHKCAFNTVQTLLRIMCQKGLVKKRTVGRADFYKPVYTEQNATNRFLDKVFDGELNKFMLSMISSEKVSSDELHELEKMLTKARKAKAKEGL